MNELLGHLLFEIEFRVKLLQRPDRFLERLELPGILARGAVQDVRILLANGSAQFIDLLAQAREHLHVTLATLDFLVEDDAVETLAP